MKQLEKRSEKSPEQMLKDLKSKQSKPVPRDSKSAEDILRARKQSLK